MVSEWLRRVTHALFGIVYVVLEDHDGELSISRVFWMAGEPHARRMGRKIRLMPDGTCRGASYVKRWKPYIPISFGYSSGEANIRVVK